MKFTEHLKMLDGGFVINGYDTERDAKLAKQTVERMLECLSDMSLYQINKELEPYRRKAAKAYDEELGRERNERTD